MTQTVDYDIVGSFNNQRVTSIDAERSVNMFEYIDALGKKPKTLINTSGLINTNSTFSGPASTEGFRAQFVFNGVEYSVVGNYVFKRTIAGLVTALGTINTAGGYVGIDANTFQVIFVDGQNGWIWDTIASTFKMITDTAFPAFPIDVCYLDGFFVVASGGTNNFQLSSFNQGMVWGPASNNFSASAATNLITIGNSTLTPPGPATTVNYTTGVSVLVIPPTTGDTFTGSAATSILTLTSTTNYPTGVPVKVSNSGGALPNPLVSGTVYYVINLSPTTIKLATTYANAIIGTAITLTTDGSPTNTIIGQLPDPLTVGTTYYVIQVSNTTIKLAATLADAQAGTAITLLSNGGPNNTILSLGQLQLGSITTHPGNIVACRTLHRRLFLFSAFYTEVWENAGIGTNLPFRRNNSLLMEYGTAAIGSISVGFDKMFFLSQDREGLGSVMEVIGSESMPVSNRALDFILAQYAAIQQISDCRGFLIKENGIIFYRMNFTDANHTYVYNVTFSQPDQEQMRLWHEEEVLNGDRHPAQTHSYFNGVNYVGSYAHPTLYQIDPNTFTNDGEKIRRMRISKAFVPPGYQRIRVDRLQLDLLQGNQDLGDIVTQELDLLAEDTSIITAEDGTDLLLEQAITLYNPNTMYVFMSISKDGGQTYGYSVRAPMGNVGQRTFRTVWRKLGTTKRGQAFVTKFEFFEDAPFVILGASWGMEVLPE